MYGTRHVVFAAIFAISLLLIAKAEAGLVEDLRSGKSNIKASSNSGAYIGVIKFWQQQKSAPDFKAIVTARSNFYGWHGDRSVELAVEKAIRYCKEQGGGRTTCQVYAVGDAVVEGYTQNELANAIEAYNLRISGPNSATSTVPRRVYCRNKDGSAFASWSSCNSGTQITVHEFRLIKAEKSDTDNRTESNSVSIEAKLKKLKQLLDKGLITPEEAKAKRAKLLEEL
jgi:hypothetical protein